jgi:hypothetical protein
MDGDDNDEHQVMTITWEGMPLRGGQNTMGKGFDIPYVVRSKYHG